MGHRVRTRVLLLQSHVGSMRVDAESSIGNRAAASTIPRHRLPTRETEPSPSGRRVIAGHGSRPLHRAQRGTQLRTTRKRPAFTVKYLSVTHRATAGTGQTLFSVMKTHQTLTRLLTRTQKEPTDAQGLYHISSPFVMRVDESFLLCRACAWPAFFFCFGSLESK